ncbi:phosphatase PAP2 family protein [Pseudonocardia adelaidensis]|uniref:Phosphatidic acid phosphatase type 2/haloperoxidase domain-containing protein n=1 Tax=Pseudonocardia adelaidensis TaxID=648754 RepID=A0ABP9P280_9PSEU
MGVPGVADRLRRHPGLLEPVVVIVALFGGHLAVVAAVQGAGGVTPLDAGVHAWFVEHRSALLDPVMIGVSAVGGTAGMAALAILTAAVLVRWGHRAQAVIVLIACAGGEALGDVAKLIYQRTRPPQADWLGVVTSYSLPSGHALLATVTVGIVAAVVVHPCPSRSVRTGVAALAIGVVLLIGTSRLYLGVHWPTDVVTGYLLGGAWLAVCVLGLTVVEPQRAPDGTDAPTVPLRWSRGRRAQRISSR